VRRRAGKQEIWPRKNYIFGVDGGNKLVHALFFTYLSFSIFCITMLFTLFRAQTCGLKATGSKSKTFCLKFYWPFRLRHAQNSTSRFDFGAGAEKLFYLLLEHYIYIYIHTCIVLHVVSSVIGWSSTTICWNIYTCKTCWQELRQTRKDHEEIWDLSHTKCVCLWLCLCICVSECICIYANSVYISVWCVCMCMCMCMCMYWCNFIYTCIYII
jgi:hypothetical protein